MKNEEDFDKDLDERFEKILNQFAENGFLDELVDLFAATGDKKMVFLQTQKKYHSQISRINELIGDGDIKDECIDQLISLMSQFMDLTKNLLSEYNIKL